MLYYDEFNITPKSSKHKFISIDCQSIIFLLGKTFQKRF